MFNSRVSELCLCSLVVIFNKRRSKLSLACFLVTGTGLPTLGTNNGLLCCLTTEAHTHTHTHTHTELWIIAVGSGRYIAEQTGERQ